MRIKRIEQEKNMREGIFKWYLKKPQNNCFHAVRKIQLFFTALIVTPHPLHQRQM